MLAADQSVIYQCHLPKHCAFKQSYSLHTQAHVRWFPEVINTDQAAYNLYLGGLIPHLISDEPSVKWELHGIEHI